MVTVDDVRRIAAVLPRTEEHLIHDRIKFRVGRIVYLALSRDETVLGFAFPREERAALVASRPGVFHLPGNSDLRFNWAQAWLAALDVDELTELIVDAWRMVVPRTVAERVSPRPPGPPADRGRPAGRRARSPGARRGP